MDLLRTLLVRNIVINTISASILVPGKVRWVLLRLYGIDIARADVRPRCFFGGSRVRIGAGAYVNTGVFFDGQDTITIGPRVHLGMQAMILTGGHAIGGPGQRAAGLEPAPVVVGEGAWVGARAVLMPGVTVGGGAVVAAGAVVTEDVPADTVCAGVPARVVRTLAVPHFGLPSAERG